MSNCNNVWRDRFLNLCLAIKTWSKDPSTQVGAVIVDEKRRVMGLGYNGFPRGVEDRPCSREEKCLRTVHAEANALLNAMRTEGCTLYVSAPPCNECAKLIIQSGIIRVVNLNVVGFGARWNNVTAEEMFEEAGILRETVEL